MKTIEAFLALVLGFIYPDVTFDVMGLSRLLLPCLLLLAVALLVYLVMKIIPAAQRFSYIALVGALFLLIAANIFLPVTLAQTGDTIGDAIQQWTQPQ